MVPADAVTSDASSLRDAAIGVNFLMPFLDRALLERVASNVRVVEFFYDDPDPALVDVVHTAGSLAAWQVGSVDEARRAADAGCDLVVAQGVEAGGHVRGTVPLAELVPAALRAVAVPVVAAGGIASRADVRRAFDAGADAVRVGTRFVVADESAAHPAYGDALCAARGDDATVLTTAYEVFWPNAPHRVLRSAVDAARSLPDDPLRWSCMPPTVSTSGRIDAMALYAGTGVDHVVRREPAAEIVRDLMGPG
jgi:NAD(P)H-dependent flavin oxidoreductase YrpB (nitropropane dioxygenase family)